MEAFLTGVVTGAHATRERHIRQAKTIQAAIESRWGLSNPWSWRKKHLMWFLNQSSKQHATATRYYYILTIRLIGHRLGKLWFG